MKKIVPALLLILLVAACQPNTPQGELPTVAVLPSETPTLTATPTDTLTPTVTPTDTPGPTDTPTASSTPTDTPIPSNAPKATATTVPTTEPTTAAIATGTAAVLEAPVFSTLTLAPNAVPPTGTPIVVADVIITEPQFQEEVNAHLPNIPAIQSARVNFVKDGISVDLTALGGEAYVTGRVLINVLLTGDFATITIGDIQVNAPEPPPEYLDLVTGDFFVMMLDSLDQILHQRLGPEQKLKNIVVTDNAIEVTLLVPQQ